MGILISGCGDSHALSNYYIVITILLPSNVDISIEKWACLFINLTIFSLVVNLVIIRSNEFLYLLYKMIINVIIRVNRFTINGTTSYYTSIINIIHLATISCKLN